MSAYRACIQWGRNGAAFSDGHYSRGHVWSFDGGVTVPASSSPEIVPLPFSITEAVDPEEALIASASSCHMLWFLSLAAKAGFVVESYRDDAVGWMEKNPERRLAITRIALRPVIHWSGKEPTSAERAALHHEAHDRCFIANSLRAEIFVEEVSA